MLGPSPSTADDLAPRGYVDAAVTANVESVIVDFGLEGGTTAQGSVLAGWVRADSVIVCLPDAAGTADHGAEDAILEGVTCVVTYLEPGIGFDVVAVSRNGTWGRYLFNCIQ